MIRLQFRPLRRIRKRSCVNSSSNSISRSLSRSLANRTTALCLPHQGRDRLDDWIAVPVALIWVCLA